MDTGLKYLHSSNGMEAYQVEWIPFIEVSKKIHKPFTFRYIYLVMAGTSNLTPDAFQFLYVSNTNVSNFVSVKLSGSQNYPLWKVQMLCLMKSHNMCGIVDDTFAGPKVFSKEIENQYESLLKGWIFRSISEDVLANVVELSSAKVVWEELKSIYGPTLVPQQDSAPAPAEIEEEDVITIHNVFKAKPYLLPIQDRINEHAEQIRRFFKQDFINRLHKADMMGDWSSTYSYLVSHSVPLSAQTNRYGDTILHVAVEKGHKDYLKDLLMFTDDETFLKQRNSDGNTALHIAATLGNTEAVDLLVKKNKSLLQIANHKGEGPLHKAYQNMHFDTIGIMLKAAGNDDGKKTKEQSFPSFISSQPGDEIGIGILVNAISAKKFTLALSLVKQYPELATKSDGVLMAIARTYPSELDYWETLIYPSWELISDSSGHRIKMYFATAFASGCCNKVDLKLSTILRDPVMMFSLAYKLLGFIKRMFHFLSVMLYYCLWKISTRLVTPIKHIERKKRELKEAKEVLEVVSLKIFRVAFSGTHHPYYTKPLLEAACQNASEFIKHILSNSPKAIQSTDENGHDIMQLAIIHRSENVYNLIHDIWEVKNFYRTVEDFSKNNILHLAGRLAPSSKLNHITGAALQLQRELQWREEVKKLVFPTFLTKENNYRETPDMVFTREHENLVKEGKQWMKTTAESCSITSTLIITIVFAAAITVPGGSNQDTGIPLFTKDTAFIIFALSDAISLFTSTTALLVFLSTLTARFSEQDFLVKLPRRMIIGLSTLLISTIAMIIAFGATLYLVFCHQKPWMLAPICALAFLPISFFIGLQFPLIVDLFWSTHVSIFGKKTMPDSKIFD